MRRVKEPKTVVVNRSVLRNKQRETLSRAKGRTVVVISANEEGDEKLVLDKVYYNEIMLKLRAAVETLEVVQDQRLLGQILNAAKTLDEDVRLGKLRSAAEAFGED